MENVDAAAAVIEELLEAGWSPEAIALLVEQARLKRDLAALEREIREQQPGDLFADELASQARVHGIRPRDLMETEIREEELDREPYSPDEFTEALVRTNRRAVLKWKAIQNGKKFK